MINGFRRAAPLIVFVVLFVPGFMFSVSVIAETNSYQNISLEQFIKMLEQKDFILINVHIPYQGEIPGTDLLIPFNQIDQHREKLPRDKHKKIVVYCMAGPMGYYAADKLTSMGYSRVIHFEGGMDAWSRSGRSLKSREK